MKAKGYVLKTTLSATDIERLLKSITQKSFLLAQQVDTIRFEDFNLPHLVNGSLTDLLKKGRIFNSDFEIRYEKNDGNYDLMVFFEKSEKIQDFNLSGAVNEYVLSESTDDIFLWGRAKNKKNKKDGWRFIEVQIPQALKYPDVDGLEDEDELVIKAYDYKQGELPCFTRFMGVEKYEPTSG